MDVANPTGGFVVLDNAAFTGSGHGTVGSTITWNGFLNTGDSDFDVTDVDGDGILVAGSDYFNAVGLTYTGYLIEGTDGNFYPVYFDGTILAVALPVDGSTQALIPSMGESEDYAADTTGQVVFICFGEGTQISTPAGTRAVEDLAIGDLVITQTGQQVPVRWVGRQSFNVLTSGIHRQLVRIRAGALGHGLPNAGLTVTSDHGMIIDDMVINASALVNGTSIDWVPLGELEESVTVYHIETEDHDVILANGAPSETFVDYVTRSHFDNYDEYLTLYGADRIIREMPQPRISSARMVPETLKVRLGIGDDPFGRQTDAA